MTAVKESAEIAQLKKLFEASTEQVKQLQTTRRALQSELDSALMEQRDLSNTFESTMEELTDQLEELEEEESEFKEKLLQAHEAADRDAELEEQLCNMVAQLETQVGEQKLGYKKKLEDKQLFLSELQEDAEVRDRRIEILESKIEEEQRVQECGAFQVFSLEAMARRL